MEPVLRVNVSLSVLDLPLLMVSWTLVIATTCPSRKPLNLVVVPFITPLIGMPTLVAQLTVHKNLLLRYVMQFPFLVYHVQEDGWKFIGNQDVGELYYHYQNAN